MQVYSIVEKEAQMNRTAQRIREIVLSQLSVHIRVCGDKNDEPCRTHAKKYLNSIYTFCCSFAQNIQSFTSTVETITQIYIH